MPATLDNFYAGDDSGFIDGDEYAARLLIFLIISKTNVHQTRDRMK